MQDEIFAAVLAQIRPGMTDNDVTALAQYEGRLLGSEQGIFLGSAAPVGGRRASSPAMSRRGRFSQATISRC